MVFLLGNLLRSPQVPSLACNLRASCFDGCRILSRSSTILRRVSTSAHSTTAPVSSLFALVSRSWNIETCGLKLLAFDLCQFVAVNPLRTLVGLDIDRNSVATVFVLGLGTMNLPGVTIQCWARLRLGDMACSSSVNGCMQLVTRKIIMRIHPATNSVHTRVVGVGVAILSSEMTFLGVFLVRGGVHVIIEVLTNHQQPRPCRNQQVLDSVQNADQFVPPSGARYNPKNLYSHDCCVAE
jgi:hypothetical protein